MPIRIADLAAECGFSHVDFISNPRRWPWRLTKAQRTRFLDPNAFVEESEITSLRKSFSGGVDWFPPNRHVTQWSIQQFKALNERQSLPLRPINLIVGPNSSGKSSVLQSFLWAHHAIRTGDLDVHLPELAATSVDLGGFENTVFRHARDGVLTFSFDVHPHVLEGEVELRAPITVTIEVRRIKFGRRSPIVKRKNKKGRKLAGRPEVVSLRVESAGQALLGARRRAGMAALVLDSCDLSHPIFTTLFTDIANAEASDELAQEKRKLTRKLLELCLKDQGIEMRGIVPVMAFESRQVGTHLKNLLKPYEPGLKRDLLEWRRMMVQRFPNFIRHFFTWVLGAFTTYLGSFRYLGPVPQSTTKSPFNVLLEDDELRAAVNEHLTHLQINFRFEVKKSKNRRTKLQILDLQNKMVVPASAAGASFNQIVSFLVGILLCTKRNAHSTILIEGAFQQVHPTLQAEMGDVFIRNALGENQNQFIMETHSEHLILRLLRRIRQSTENDPEYPKGLPRIRPEDVSVTYVEPTEDGSVLRRLTVTPDGDFADQWPGGFFTERGRELF